MDRDNNINKPLSDEVYDALLASDAYGVPFGAGLSINGIESLGYGVDSNLGVSPGDANKPDECVKINYHGH